MSVYEKSYGAVQFYDTTGTLLFDSVETYGMWTSEDTEPSPDVKWTRVSVPGADGAVDLSRALAGQVTYEQREIQLQFSAKRRDHSDAVAFLRSMRSMLHGARVRIATVLTNLAGGYYVADTECDGTVYPDGSVTIDVRAWADPFIHVGSHELQLPASAITAYGAAVTQVADGSLVAGAGRITATMGYGTIGCPTPMGATTGRLWYACGDDPDSTNLLDVSRLNVVGYDSASNYRSDIVANGHDIVLGTLDGSDRIVHITSGRRTGTIRDHSTTGIPFLGGDNTNPGTVWSIGVYLTGTIRAVGSSPTIFVQYTTGVSSTDARGVPTAGTDVSTRGTVVTGLAKRSYDDTLVCFDTADVSEIRSPIFSVSVHVSGITASDLRMRLVATRSSDGMPTHWRKPRLGYVTIDFGGTFCHTDAASDTAVISPAGVTTTHRCEPLSGGYTATAIATPYVTTGGLDGWLPEGARLLCLGVTNVYGEDCPVTSIAADTYSMQVAHGTNDTMRSTPTITSVGGAYVSVGGESMVVDGGTHELQQLTLGAGDFEVSYATLSEDAATLTWEGGVL